MAAALKTIEILRTTPAFEQMTAAGERFRAGITKQVEQLQHVTATYTGPVTMPYVVFADDAAHERISRFSVACLQHGLYLHPKHNWFLSAAHDDETIDQALDATAHAFAEVDTATA